MNKIKSFQKYIMVSLVMFSTFMVSATAPGLGTRMTALSSEGGIFANLLMLIIGIAGVLLLFLGITGLKKYADNAQQNPLSKPLIYTIAGGLLTGFSVFQSLLSGSLLGTTGDDTTGRSGFSANEAGGG